MKSRLILLIATISLCHGAERTEVTGSAGYLKPFLDETGGLAWGGSLRILLTDRLAVRPEVVGGDIAGYRRVLAVGSVTFDVTNPEAPAVVYLVGGAGVSHSYHRIISYSYDEWTALGGAGIRYRLGSRWTATMEFRVGSDAFPLITGGIGYKFGTRK